MVYIPGYLDTTVRYIGMNTPETVHPTIGEEPYGQEASAKNKELVEGKIVRLEKDVSETDQYGRLLRYVYVDDVFVNAELVRLGYAQVSTYPPDVKYQDLFLQLQREAMEAGRGLWAKITPISNPTPTTVQPPSTALSLHIESVNSPVNPGDYATLVASTLPGAQCTIAVYYKSGASKASGLLPINAGTNGVVSWSWKVGTNTTPGSWEIVVTASLDGETVTQTTRFTIQ
ncbi:thermonuclease family protein [Chloroflexota bacterium]